MSTYGGDSYTNEHIVQRNRQAQVLGDFIPDNEARRLQNGKYLCLVCPSKPIFVDAPSLAVHRGGKKHKEQMETFKATQRELKDIQQKRDFEQALHQVNKSRAAQQASESLPEDDQPLLQATKKRTQNALQSYPHSTTNQPTFQGTSESFFTPSYQAKPAPQNKRSGGGGGGGGIDYAQVQQYNAEYYAQIASFYNNMHHTAYKTAETSLEIPYNSLAYKYDPNPQHAKKKVKTSKGPKMDPEVLKELRKKDRLFEKGYRWDANGVMYRDETVEWESDDEEDEIFNKAQAEKEQEQENTKENGDTDPSLQEEPVVSNGKETGKDEPGDVKTCNTSKEDKSCSGVAPTESV